MALHLLLRLEAPLMSFGTLAVDANRPVQRWPAVSMLTGLLANALGWRRTDVNRLERLQQRLRWAARLDRPGEPLHDFQTAELAQSDRGWTTRGRPEGRDGGPDTFKSPHIRQREYRADASVALAMGLDPADESPTLRDLEAALRRPRRPLFIGRKSCLPSTPLLVPRDACVAADDALAALEWLPPALDAVDRPAVFFNHGAALRAVPSRAHRCSDERRFTIDAHAGRQTVHEWLREAGAGRAAP